MTLLSHERHCAEIVRQTNLLRSCTADADLMAPVPSCPGWNVGQLLRHLGGGHRWAEKTVRTRATHPLPDDHFRVLSAYTHEDAALLGPWLTEGAEKLAEALRAAGPDAAVWTPVPEQTARFYARRFAHEALIHRADATLAMDRDFIVAEDFTVDEDLALDAMDEWMELGSVPQLFDVHPEKRDLLGPGHTLHFHATDTAPEAAAEWLVDLTGDTIEWRRTHEKAAVAVRGPLSELLLLVYRRRPAQSKHIEILGDAELLDFWLERVGFG
ncbi:maleylpyruvate isomerase family mycothiol-dependent enzyme [Streptomyces sp. 2A115]|uniref:maleylpyruvate isomerase family mycothiol-dependent enzyme n=1 Tax=Streptomyces sp. 2A115 TaxID=3457439 RepID=UPI003FD27019